MTERETILALLRLGWTLRRIERETGHRRETIGRYGREAGLLPPKAAKVATDPGESVVAAPATVTEAATNPGPPERTRSRCEEHRDFIEAETAKGRNAMAIYQDLV